MNKYSSLSVLREMVVIYNTSYRHPDLESLHDVGLYDLFPRGKSETPYEWPDEWPCWDSAGVYVIVSSSLQVAYVGKASMNSFIAARLGTYFRKAADGRCEVRHSWNLHPRYVAIIPTKLKFEAPALEEFLISKLNTSDNKAGTS